MRCRDPVLGLGWKQQSGHRDGVGRQQRSRGGGVRPGWLLQQRAKPSGGWSSRELADTQHMTGLARPGPGALALSPFIHSAPAASPTALTQTLLPGPFVPMFSLCSSSMRMSALHTPSRGSVSNPFCYLRIRIAIELVCSALCFTNSCCF